MVNIALLRPLAEQLRLIRETRGLSLRLVAKQAGISATYLHKLERGEVQNPSPKVLQGLAAALRIDYQQLMELAGYLVPVLEGVARQRTGEFVLIAPNGAEPVTPEEAKELSAYLAWYRHRSLSRAGSQPPLSERGPELEPPGPR